MRISDWSSDVCSSDLTEPVTRFENAPQRTPSPLVAQQIFEIATGEVTTVATGNGQIVAQLKEILPPAEENRDARLEQVESKLTASLQHDIFQQFLNERKREYAVNKNKRRVQETRRETGREGKAGGKRGGQ